MPVANARLGQTYRFQDASQQWQERTNWHSLSFYGDISKIALAFEKGENIFVEGTIEQREFTPKDGSKRVVSEIIVRHCHVIAPGAWVCDGGSRCHQSDATKQRIHSRSRTGSEPRR